MTDDATGAEPKIVSASFADPYVLLVRDDASVMILRADESGDLDEVERGDDLLTTKWLSGSLYEDSNDGFRMGPDEEAEDDGVNVLMFLLSADGGLHVCDHHDIFTSNCDELALRFCTDISSLKPKQGSLRRCWPQLPSALCFKRIYSPSVGCSRHVDGDSSGRSRGLRLQITVLDRR